MQPTSHKQGNAHYLHHPSLYLHVLSSQNASAWRCFTFSKNPVAVTAEESLQAGHMTQLSSPSVMNHVMHASYGEVRPANCTAVSRVQMPCGLVVEQSATLFILLKSGDAKKCLPVMEFYLLTF